MSDELEPQWWLYIVQTKHNHWYTGVSNNVAQRFCAHQQGSGAKNLRGKGPLKLVFATPVGTRSQACKLEYQVKQLTRAKKEAFVSKTPSAHLDVLQQLADISKADISTVLAEHTS